MFLVLMLLFPVWTLQKKTHITGLWLARTAAKMSRAVSFFVNLPLWRTLSQCFVYRGKGKDFSSFFEFIQSVSSIQALGRVRLFATPWTAARQTSLSITNSPSLPKPVSILLVTPSSHLILCCLLLLLPSIFPRIRVFSNESAFRIG